MLSRVALLALAGCAVLVGAWLLTSGEEPVPAEPAGAATRLWALPAVGSQTAKRRRARPSMRSKLPTLDQSIGQRIITRYRGAEPTASVLGALRSGRVGGVILFADNVPTPAVARAAVRSLRHAARAGDQPPPFVMVDQEGGSIRRFATLPPARSPARLGATRTPGRSSEGAGRRTGAALRSVGVNVDLAPVADVPRGSASFLADRAFSRSQGVVAEAACAFAAGLAAEHVAPTLKHFPGLGRAPGNTDHGSIRVTATRAELTADLAAYGRCGAKVPMVMLSSASYPALGIFGPAVLDRRAYRLLAETGFKGLSISDAFDAPALAGEPRPALRALAAGIDLLLYTRGEAGAEQAFARLRADVREGRLGRRELRARSARVIAFKQLLEAGELEHGGW